jgi:hypothetical protein
MNGGAGVYLPRRILAVVMLLFSLLGPVRATEFNGAGAAAVDMMNIMRELMAWFLDRRGPAPERYPLPWQYGSAIDPYRDLYALPLEHPAPQVLDGVWSSPSGEYWLVKGNRFALVNRSGQRFDGMLRREGPFILIRLPQGEQEFAYRLRGELLVLRDVTGLAVTLRRIRRPQWRW